jgi:Ras-related protein Rab-5C
MIAERRNPARPSEIAVKAAMRTAGQSTGRLIRSEKIVLIGAASSGKTSLVNRFTRDHFVANSDATIGAAFMSKTITVEGTDIKLEIWDTGGSEKYKALAPMYYREARAAIIVFDITSRHSFEEAGEWLSEFRERGQPTALVVGAANKVDLEDQRNVSESDVRDFASENQLEFWKATSALSGVGVHELFAELARLLLALPAVRGTEIAVNKESPQGKDSNCC